MKRVLEILVCLSALIAVLSFLRPELIARPQQPGINPAPCPEPDCDRRRRRPRWDIEEQRIGDGEKGIEGGPTSPDGAETVQVDILPNLRAKNVGGKDGAGLCVFTSIMHSARDQCERKLWNLQHDMTQELGGGYPEKVDQMIKKYGAGTKYVQYEGADLAVLRAALATGRSPGITYDGTLDPHYSYRKIAHMVNLVHLSEKWACILDNNFIGDTQLIWLRPDAFKRTWMGGRNGWAVILLEPAAAPIPRN